METSLEQTDITHGATLIVNGTTVGVVDWQGDPDGPLFDVSQFMEGLGGRFTPVIMNSGIVAQYGNRIGFASNGYEYGMVQTQLCEMVPHSKEDAGSLWAPQGFLEALLKGKVVLDKNSNTITVTAPAPQQIGDIIPAAKSLADALKTLGYIVMQGSISPVDCIQVCYAGYSPNCNGNNADFPYFTIQLSLPPDTDYAILPQQFDYTMGADEGLIIIGNTPPECDYYSYRSYLLNRCINNEDPVKRKKIFTQLGDPINNFNIMDDIFYPVNKGSVESLFRSFFILVSTSNRWLYNNVLQAVHYAGLDQNKVLLDVVDHNLLRLGNDDFADGANFVHRFSNPYDQQAADEYKKHPPLEVLRLTPNKSRQADFIEPFSPRKRGSGITENYLLPTVNLLQKAIIDKYSPNYNIHELKTKTWLYDSGAEAMYAMEDVMGETRDTLYLKTGNFKFNSDTIIIVYGVNHATVPKSIYNDVNCYGSEYSNGFGHITNYMYINNVVRNFPSLAKLHHIDKLYVWYFSRTEGKDTFVVPQDIYNNLTGINNGDDAFMGFRAYIDPNSPDLIGPAPNEIIFDQAMVLTPKN